MNNIEKFIQEAKENKDKTHLSFVAMYDNRKVITLEDGQLNFLERYSRIEEFSKDQNQISAFHSLFNPTCKDSLIVERMKAAFEEMDKEINKAYDMENIAYLSALRDCKGIIKKHFELE